VPFEVTGDGPTISDGLAMCALLREEPPSIEDGWRLDESAELRADLQKVLVGGMETEELHYTYKE
jgi:hypothetical protein